MLDSRFNIIISRVCSCQEVIYTFIRNKKKNCVQAHVKCGRRKVWERMNEDDDKKNISIIYVLLIFMHFATFFYSFSLFIFFIIDVDVVVVVVLTFSSFVMAGWMQECSAHEVGIYIRSGSCWRSISFLKYKFTFIRLLYRFHTQQKKKNSSRTQLGRCLTHSHSVFVTIFWCSLIATLMSTVTSYDKLMFMLLGLWNT